MSQISAFKPMLFPLRRVSISSCILFGLFSFVSALSFAADTAIVKTEKPALTVSLVKAEARNLTNTLITNGTIAAWQEASVSAEVHGLRLIEINAAVGDTVKKGQVLARFDVATVIAEIASSKAQLAEAQASADEARANADRARELAKQGFYSNQAISQASAQEKAALARLDVARANLALQNLRLEHSLLRAPDSGIITARNAAVGSVVAAGVELFRMNRQGRLEWRAEVTSTELPAIVRGGKVNINMGANNKIVGTGTVRQIAPNLDAQTRNAIVYVDIAAGSTLKVGQFVRGEFAGNVKTVLTLPVNALVLRDGFNYVFVVKDNKAVQTKVSLGQHQGSLVEIIEGLPSQANVVAVGAVFLTDGDIVKVVQP